MKIPGTCATAERALYGDRFCKEHRYHLAGRLNQSKWVSDWESFWISSYLHCLLLPFMMTTTIIFANVQWWLLFIPLRDMPNWLWSEKADSQKCDTIRQGFPKLAPRRSRNSVRDLQVYANLLYYLFQATVPKRKKEHSF